MDNDLQRDIEERDARCAWRIIIGFPGLQWVAAAATKAFITSWDMFIIYLPEIYDAQYTDI